MRYYLTKSAPKIKYDDVLPLYHTAGSFGLVSSRKNQWHVEDVFYCREAFHEFSSHIKKFVFFHGRNNGYNIALFIHKIEKQLKIRPFTVFGATSRNMVTSIQISPWWRPSMRRSLFTALLRAGMHYNPQRDNFEEALLCVDYLSRTKTAVLHFLAGNTVYKGNAKEWYEQFYELARRTRNSNSQVLYETSCWDADRDDAKSLDQLLIKPTK